MQVRSLHTVLGALTPLELSNCWRNFQASTRHTRSNGHVADVGVERTMRTGDACSVVRILWVLSRGHLVRCPAPTAAAGCLLEMAWFQTPRRGYPGWAFLRVPMLPFLAESVASGRVPAIFRVLCLAPATWEVTCTLGDTVGGNCLRQMPKLSGLTPGHDNTHLPSGLRSP